MESTLHRQLKTLYAGPQAACEVRLSGYRIDAVVKGRLIEIQQASLGALRCKVATLLESHRVLIVKPLFARKIIVRREPRTQLELSRRASPTHETVWNLFLDLVHFVHVFPHPKLQLDVVLAEIEEHRMPRARPRWRRRDRVTDRVLIEIQEEHTFRSTRDLMALLPAGLPTEFTTADLASATGLPRWWAQKVAYCLRHTGGLTALARGRGGWVYTRTKQRRAA